MTYEIRIENPKRRVLKTHTTYRSAKWEAIELAQSTSGTVTVFKNHEVIAKFVDGVEA